MVTAVAKMLVRKIVKIETEVAGLAERLRETQKKSGRSVREVTAAIGITPNYWHMLVAGKAELSWDLLQKIQRELGVDFGVEL